MVQDISVKILVGKSVIYSERSAIYDWQTLDSHLSLVGIPTLTFSLPFFSLFLYTNKVMLSMSRALLLLIFFQQLNQSTFVLLIYTSYNTFVALILLIDTDRYFLGYYFCLYLFSVTLNVKLCWHGLLFEVLLIFLHALLCYYTGLWRGVFPEVVPFFTIISSGPLSELVYKAHKERLKRDIPHFFDWVFCFVLKLLEFFKRHDMKEEAEWYQSRLEFIDNES